MSEGPLLLTIIIPVRPEQSRIVALEALAESRLLRDRFEVLLARGSQPSRQRNTALRAARGEWVYFLDDDSQVEPETLTRLESRLRDASPGVIGGPNLCPEDARTLQKVFAGIMAHPLAFGPSAARYRRLGELRETTEKELILCNMVARRADLVAAGGFDEALYPNEENALLDQLRANGQRLWYDPELVVYRYPRPTLGAFLVMLFRYGRGRGEQVRRHPTFGSVLNFVPALWVLYCVLLVGFAWVAREASSLWWIGLLPALAYGLVVLGGGFTACRRHGIGLGLPITVGLVVTHWNYGLGLWKGLFFPGGRPTDSGSVRVESVELAGVGSNS